MTVSLRVARRRFEPSGLYAEVQTSLQSGAIDGQGNLLPIVQIMKFSDVSSPMVSITILGFLGLLIGHAMIAGSIPHLLPSEQDM